MYSITDLKKDTLIQLDGVPYRVIEYAQKQMGRGGSIVNTKLKNLLDDSVIPKTFKGSDKIEPAQVLNQSVQFLYSEGDNYFFMDEKTFDQFEVERSIVGNASNYLKEGDAVVAQFFQNRVINIEMPIKTTLKVVEADPGIKGDTVGSAMKSCILETGMRVMVPLFINTGDEVVIDTRDGSYVERKKS
ncbi:elongation factor P [Candidatus Saccharibacteria bacterium CPR2]|nr:elongation factor P [Candidatus Saccharibacteria bacterium CPR2]